MGIISKLKILLLLLLFSFIAFAQDVPSQFSADDLKVIQHELNVSSYLYQVSMEIENKAVQPLSESAWMKELEDKSMTVMQKMYFTTAEDAPKIEKFRKLFKWKTWWEHTKKLAANMKNYTKTKGFGVAFAFVATLPSEIVGPILVTYLGHPEWSGFAAAFPASTLAVGGQMAVQKYFVKKELIQSFGSKEAYNSFVEARKENAKLLSETSIDNYIHKLSMVDNELEVIVIEKESFMKKLMVKTGFKKEGVTFSNVVDFCERRGLHQDDLFVKSLIETKELPKEQKAGLILEYLRTTGDDVMVSDIYDWFGDGIKRVNVSKQMEEVYQLTKNLHQAKNIDELKGMIINASETIDAKLFADVWRNRSLEMMSGTLESSHFQYRRLIQNFTALYGTIHASPGQILMNKDMKLKFLDYLEFAQHKKHLCNDVISPL